MSKMSQLHAELTQQAYDLGFESIEDAERNGYHVTYTDNEVKLALDMTKAQEQAHEAWLKEKEDILDGLEHLKNIYKEVKPDEDIIERTINFIKKGEI